MPPLRPLGLMRLPQLLLLLLERSTLRGATALLPLLALLPPPLLLFPGVPSCAKGHRTRTHEGPPANVHAPRRHA